GTTALTRASQWLLNMYGPPPNCNRHDFPSTVNGSVTSVSCAHLLVLLFRKRHTSKHPENSLFLVTNWRRVFCSCAERKWFPHTNRVLDYWCNYYNSSPGIGEGIAPVVGTE